MGKILSIEIPKECNISTIYAATAVAAGRDPENTQYDCRRLKVSKAIYEAYRAYMESIHAELDIGQHWMMCGPKTDETLTGNTVEVEDGFFRNYFWAILIDTSSGKSIPARDLQNIAEYYGGNADLVPVSISASRVGRKSVFGFVVAKRVQDRKTLAQFKRELREFLESGESITRHPQEFAGIFGRIIRPGDAIYLCD